VLPGQGAFGDSVDNLRRQGLERPLLDAVEAGLPLLGICVGMQLLFDTQRGDGRARGTAPDSRRGAPLSRRDARPAHPGRMRCACRRSAGTQLHIRRPIRCWPHVPDGAYAYFAHSYYCDAADPTAVLATTDYGIDYPSIVRYRNAWGIQPHPEKSHTVGLRILANFMQMVAGMALTPRRGGSPTAITNFRKTGMDSYVTPRRAVMIQ
jgi:glutamine amidotransferase